MKNRLKKKPEKQQNAFVVLVKWPENATIAKDTKVFSKLYKNTARFHGGFFILKQDLYFKKKQKHQ